MTLVDSVGKSRASLVKHDQSRERRKAVEKAREWGISPELVDVRRPARDENQVERPLADRLIRDAYIGALGILRLPLYGAVDTTLRVCPSDRPHGLRAYGVTVVLTPWEVGRKDLP